MCEDFRGPHELGSQSRFLKRGNATCQFCLRWACEAMECYAGGVCSDDGQPRRQGTFRFDSPKIDLIYVWQ